MNQIVVDQTLGAQLIGLDRPVAVYDQSGLMLGRFVPEPKACQYEPSAPQISAEELERRRRDKGQPLTTAQVLAHLEKL
jgi:hypothetical protein